MQIPEDENEREVDLGDGFEKSVFFKKLGIFRMPDERQGLMENKAEKPGRHSLVSRGLGGRQRTATPAKEYRSN